MNEFAWIPFSKGLIPECVRMLIYVLPPQSQCVCVSLSCFSNEEWRMQCALAERESWQCDFPQRSFLPRGTNQSKCHSFHLSLHWSHTWLFKRPPDPLMPFMKSMHSSAHLIKVLQIERRPGSDTHTHTHTGVPADFARLLQRLVYMDHYLN